MERGRVSIDQNRMQVHLDDKPVPLTVTEFWLVHSLARYPGHVKNRDQLMSDAGVVVDDGTITSHVKRIRRKFQSIAPDFEESKPSTAPAIAGKEACETRLSG